ncbi:hypothetical protein COZ55_01245, partial [archaeon CG_4_8_14_3_um_filter_38_5]
MRLHNLLKKEGIEPDLVSLDQCFMKNPEIIRLIIKTADLKKSDVVCEIGAGTGILTIKMSRLCRKIFAVEKDARLYNLLSSLLGKKENVEIIIG